MRIVSRTHASEKSLVECFFTVRYISFTRAQGRVQHLFESECIVSLRTSTIDAAQEFSQLSLEDLVFKVTPDQSESHEDEDQYNSV